MRFILSAVLLGLLCGLWGCSLFGLGATPSDQPPSDLQIEIQHILTSLQQRNQQIDSFKGIGQAKLRENSRRMSSRIAWAGAKEGKLRIDILAASGQPVASLASDGHFLYLLSHFDQRYHKKRARNASLRPILKLPIKTNDLITLLRGRVPVVEHQYADLRPKPTGSGYVLILKKPWYGTVEKIYLDETKRTVTSVDFMRNNDLLFRVSYAGNQAIEGFQIPKTVTVSNGDAIHFELRIDRYWVNPVLSSQLFVIQPPRLPSSWGQITKTLPILYRWERKQISLLLFVCFKIGRSTWNCIHRWRNLGKACQVAAYFGIWYHLWTSIAGCWILSF